MQYNLGEHRHRFAVWAAARASQRGFTTVDILRNALEATDIRTFIANSAFLHLQPAEFEPLHRQWCHSICSALNERKIANVNYGRAAKLIAVYLKAMVIVGGGADTPLGHCIHPPIDRILLQNLAADPRVESAHKSAWRTTNWTQLVEEKYYTLIKQLREVVPADLPFWMIEVYWSPLDSGE